ncbi:hypothetical protein P4S73_02465 [Paraglaciecola sp. Hal342]
MKDAQAELITKLIEVKMKYLPFQKEILTQFKAMMPDLYLALEQQGAVRAEVRGNVINNGEGIRDSSSENSAKAIGRNTESERLHSDERNASKSKGRNNSNRSTNSDGKTRTKIYDFTKQTSIN